MEDLFNFFINEFVNAFVKEFVNSSFVTSTIVTSTIVNSFSVTLLVFGGDLGTLNISTSLRSRFVFCSVNTLRIGHKNCIYLMY